MAEELLAQWPTVAAKFVKVMPRDYRRVLLEQLQAAPEAKATTNGKKTNGKKANGAAKTAAKAATKRG